MVLVQNKYKNTRVGVLRTQITFVTHSSPSCYVTLRTQVIRLNSGNLGPQKTDSGVLIIVYVYSYSMMTIQQTILDSPAAKWYILTERGIEGYTMFYWLFGISQGSRSITQRVPLWHP